MRSVSACSTRCRHAAARAMRDAMLATRGTEPPQMAMTMRTLARAVWRQDVSLANATILRHPWTAQLVRVHGCAVSILDPTSFQAAFDEHHRAASVALTERLRQEEEASRPGEARRARANFRRAARRPKLWDPGGRKRVVGALPDEYGIAEALADRAAALARHWAPLLAFE